MPGWCDELRVTYHGCKKLKKDEYSLLNNECLVNPMTSSDPSVTSAFLMSIAAGIVQRYEERGKILPSLKPDCRNDPTRAQEYKDASKLHCWKIHTSEKLTAEVLNYLNVKMPGWKKGNSGRDAAMQHKLTPLQALLMKARDLVERCRLRHLKGLPLLPRFLPRQQQDTPELILEHRDAMKLREWKKFVQIGSGMVSLNRSLDDTVGVVPDEDVNKMKQALMSYLGKELSCWLSFPLESSPAASTTNGRRSQLSSCNISTTPPALNEGVHPKFHSISPTSKHGNIFQAYKNGSILDHDVGMFPKMHPRNQPVQQMYHPFGDINTEAERVGIAALLELRNGRFCDNRDKFLGPVTSRNTPDVELQSDLQPFDCQINNKNQAVSVGDEGTAYWFL